ncbi:hypothetical protein AB0M64_05140 [Streptomyces sp. NPDC051771]|uniref:hypothetical protein n=1 Tax=Streptomyces sp. NPDC051771 TaxID=3154847 RepID=UPI0034141584
MAADFTYSLARHAHQAGECQEPREFPDELPRSGSFECDPQGVMTFMAWDEWERLKSSAVEQDSGRMQLNGVPPEDRPNAGFGRRNLCASR